MTDTLFFDTDCLSAFLWVNNESLLPRLYPGKIVIPQPMYTELCRPSVSHLKARVDQLTEAPAAGHTMIGNGEAASISLAKQYGGIVASNNLRDVAAYVKEYNLQHTTTGKILVDAYQRGMITESEGNNIWTKMLAKRRKLGATTFSEYLNRTQSHDL